MEKPNKHSLFSHLLTNPSAVNYEDSYERLPAYYRLQKTIEQEIVDGTKKAGEQLPSERRYASTYNLSVGTVRKALDKLVQDGLLERTQGKGTFVLSRAVQNEALRYYRYVKGFSSIYQSLSIKLLSVAKEQGERTVCRSLAVEDESCLICLKRLFKLNEVPMVYSISYFPHSLFPDMDILPPEVFEEQTLYMTIEERFGLPTKEVKEFFSAVAANSETAEQLHLPLDNPVLCVNMLAISLKNTIYECRQSYCNTESYNLLRDKGLF